MVMSESSHHALAVTLQERVVAAICDEARAASERLEAATQGDVAVEHLETLATLVDAWRAERTLLIRTYLDHVVPLRQWRTRVRAQDERRPLDLEPEVCVRHAWRWLRPANGRCLPTAQLTPS